MTGQIAVCLSRGPVQLHWRATPSQERTLSINAMKKPRYLLLIGR